MSRYTILLIILIILLPCSCRRTYESKRSDFLRFEQLMLRNPDSVLSSLQAIDPERLSRGEQAWYYLLKTEAEDKLYRDHTTDSPTVIIRRIPSSLSLAIITLRQATSPASPRLSTSPVASTQTGKNGSGPPKSF